MKTLLLLRHAKSSWKRPDLEDHDRPLKNRGKKAAPRVGRLLAKDGRAPELIVSSSARRARDTALLVVESLGFRGELRFESELYEAEPAQIRRVLADLPEVERVLVVGHNPGLEALIAELTGEEARLPTAALAELRLEIDRWDRIVDPHAARLVEVVRPKDLTPGGGKKSGRDAKAER